MAKSPRDPNRNKLPKPQQIVDYWRTRVSDLGVYHDWQEELSETECFACGDGRRVARCHIVPYAHGGANSVENLMLLCPRCHEESEHIPPDVFWTWLHNQRRTVWETPIDHQLRRIRSYGLVEKALASGVDPDNPKQILDFMRLAMSPLKNKDDAQ
jgi:hypothetical protein